MLVWVCLVLCGLMACEGAGPTLVAIAPPTLAATAGVPMTAVATQTLVPLPATYTPTPLASPTVRPSPTPMVTLTPVATADLTYVGYAVDELAARSYGEGEVQIVETLDIEENFTRYLFRYPSDGLTLYGFMNVPNEGDDFPVALVLHGFMPLETYEVETYTTRYADALAEAGYFVFHPNYRNHPPSDVGDYNLFRVDYAVDVLNLVGIIQKQSADETGALRRADAENLHVMGHSMGGGIVQRVLSVRPAWFDAAVLYGSMSGDEGRNFEKIIVWSEGENGGLELDAPPTVLAAVSPINYLWRWQTPVSIHHGSADATVPPAWSDDLCVRLQEQSHPVECFVYAGAPHTFYGGADALFMERMVAFFRAH